MARSSRIPAFIWPFSNKYGPEKLADVFGSTSTSTHGVFREVRPGGHTGWDLRAPIGTKIRAMAPGEVYALTSGDCGYGVRIAHGNGFTSSYCHFNTPPKVKVGDRVRYNTVLGFVGETGNANYPHLHISIEFFGRRVDPLPLLAANHGRWRAFRRHAWEDIKRQVKELQEGA